ncbi:MAG: alpha/beta hydrolase fold domain-containing protein, partial [Isosphaeraceae bacterium]
MASYNERTFLPKTVSPEWANYYETVPDAELIPMRPLPDDHAAWAAIHSDYEAQRLEGCQAIADRLGVSIAEKSLGGVPVLDIKPAGWVDDGRVLVYAHGGAYTFFTARSTLSSSAVAAHGTGMRVISIDYTNPPAARWPQVIGEVVAVLAALGQAGHDMQKTAVFGDSAGGALAAGAVLKMRDDGLKTPAAVVLWSPWSDITESGDSFVTLKSYEPAYIYETCLAPAAAAYADPADHQHPYVSPVYGDYSKGFPPTLIQGGTREIFLSNFVRHYRAIDAGGQKAVLDLYEGMPHVFQNKLPDSPEARTALAKMKQ